MQITSGLADAIVNLVLQLHPPVPGGSRVHPWAKGRDSTFNPALAGNK